MIFKTMLTWYQAVNTFDHVSYDFEKIYPLISTEGSLDQTAEQTLFLMAKGIFIRNVNQIYSTLQRNIGQRSTTVTEKSIFAKNKINERSTMRDLAYIAFIGCPHEDSHLCKLHSVTRLSDDQTMVAVYQKIIQFLNTINSNIFKPNIFNKPQNIVRW